MASTHDSFAQEERTTVRLHVRQTNHPVGVSSAGCGVELGGDRTDQLDVGGQFAGRVDQNVLAGRRRTDIAWPVNVPVGESGRWRWIIGIVAVVIRFFVTGWFRA